jgi:VWFA-related protein
VLNNGTLENAATRAEAAGAERPGLSGKDSRPGRYVIYVFDDLCTAFADFPSIREAALRYFRSGFSATDRGAIYTFSGRVSLDFTNDRAKLEESVMKIGLQAPKPNPCPDVSYYLADLILNKGDQRALEAVTAQTMACAHVRHDMAERLAESAARQELTVGQQTAGVSLGTIKNAIRHLSEMPGQRLIVLASPGFFAQTSEAKNSTAHVLDLAARAQVIISALDPSGLYMVQADTTARRDLPQVQRQYYQQSAQARGDVLADLAEGAGGILFHNNNDLNAGFARVAAVPEFSYVLGFSPAALKADGSYHSLKVQLLNQKGANIQARKGYYAQKQGSTEDTAEEDIHDMVFAQEEIGDIPVDVVTQVSKSGTSAARLIVMANLRVTWLHFRKVDARNRDSLIVVSAVFDRDGGYVVGARNTVNLALRNETLALTDHPGIGVQSEFEVKPGTYRVRVVVRELSGKAISAHNVAVTIP